MTPVERVARALVQVIAWIVAVASGIFMLLYLYRWEWNRAMISGLFFVAAELALATAAILRRMRRIEERLDETPPPATDPPVETPARPFAWLDGTEGESVFVPILLGVGVIISGIAWVVERLAGAWSFGGEAAAERRLRGLPPAPDALLAPVAELAGGAAGMRFAPPARPPRRVGAWVLTVAAAALLLVAAVNGLAELTMYRPDPPAAGGSTAYTLSVQLRDGAAVDDSIVETLWLSCRGNVPGHAAFVQTMASGRFTLHVAPALGRNDDRRLVGCLEDLRLDFVIVDVLAGETRGEPPAWPAEDTMSAHA